MTHQNGIGVYTSTQTGTPNRGPGLLSR